MSEPRHNPPPEAIVEFESNVEGRSVLYFPPELITQILRYLPPRSLARFSSVSSLFSSLICHLPFLLSLPHPHPPPLALQIFEPSQFNLSTIHLLPARSPSPSTPAVQTTVTVHVPSESLLHFSTAGLFLLEVVGSSVSFSAWNPLTSELIPVRSLDPFLEPFAFYSAFNSIRILWRESRPPDPDLLQIEVQNLGSDRRRRIETSLFCPRHGDISSDCPVLVHGHLHWLCDLPSFTASVTGVYPVVSTFDLEKEKFGCIEAPPEVSYVCARLLELDGDVGLCGFRRNGEIEVWLLEEYAKMEWVKRHAMSVMDVVAPLPSLLTQDVNFVVPLVARGGRELLLQVRCGRDFLFLFDLKSKTSSRVGDDGIWSEKFFVLSALPHRESLLSEKILSQTLSKVCGK